MNSNTPTAASAGTINGKIICPPNNYDPDDWLNTNNGLQELLEAKQNADFVTTCSGGNRAVSEACLHIMEKFFEPFK